MVRHECERSNFDNSLMFTVVKMLLEVTEKTSPIVIVTKDVDLSRSPIENVVTLTISEFFLAHRYSSPGLNI